MVKPYQLSLLEVNMSREPFLVLEQMYNSYEEPQIVEDEYGDVYQRIKILETVPLSSVERLEDYFALMYGLQHHNTPGGKFYIVGKMKFDGDHACFEHPKGHKLISFTDIHIESVGDVCKVYIDIWLCNKNRDTEYQEQPLDISTILNKEKGEYLFPELDYDLTSDSCFGRDKVFNLYL